MRYADIIKRVTIAPEEPGAMAFIRQLSARGIVASIGHSTATYEQVARAVEAGASHVTHLYSAMSTVTRVEAKRYAGVLEAALERDDLTTEVIADGKHLPTSLLRLAFKCKGPEKLILVSDSTRALGMPEGKLYELCGQMALHEDGVGYTPDKKAFAGSVITMAVAVRHMVQTVGVSLRDVLTMASLTPAKIMGIESSKGSLQAGKDADLVILHRTSLSPIYVMAMGQQAVDRR
jgi:N-acetylglucosamine-6-phosphate deacetylase